MCWQGIAGFGYVVCCVYVVLCLFSGGGGGVPVDLPACGGRGGGVLLMFLVFLRVTSLCGVNSLISFWVSGGPLSCVRALLWFG